jgi:large subunit ribosomal protein L31
MREKIHPDYVEATVHCSCGNTFKTRSTKSELHVELCDLCHPFYTGQQKFVDTGGRVQRFGDKFGSAAEDVLARENAQKQARQKAHEESLAASRAAREKRERDAADAAEKAAARAPKVEAPAPVAPVAETPIEASVEDAHEEPTVEPEESKDSAE